MFSGNKFREKIDYPSKFLFDTTIIHLVQFQRENSSSPNIKKKQCQRIEEVAVENSISYLDVSWIKKNKALYKSLHGIYYESDTVRSTTHIHTHNGGN